MEQIKKHILERYSKNEHIVGLVLIHDNEHFPFHLKKYSYYVLAISTISSHTQRIEHLEINQARIYVKTVHLSEVDFPVTRTSRYHLLDWLISGDIIMDKEGQLQALRDQMIEFPEQLRSQKIFKEYVEFIDRLFHAERNLSEGNILDSYSYIFDALHHWARIVLIENGLHPAITVWEQLKDINLGVYKLYEELIASPETIEKRVELVVLASEFSTIDKMKMWSKYLIDVMSEKEGYWTMEQLQSHPKLQFITEDITIVVQKLVFGQVLIEVSVERGTVNETCYALNYV